MRDEIVPVPMSQAPAVWLRKPTVPAGIRKIRPFELVVPPIVDAVSYRLQFADSRGWRGVLVSERASFDLSPVWGHLAVGYVRYNVIGHTDSGAAMTSDREGYFVKGTPTRVTELAPPRMSWQEASHAHFRYFSSLPTEDENGESLPVWLRHAYVHLESGKLAAAVYPAQHYIFYIWSLLRYRELDSDPEVTAFIRTALRALFQAVQRFRAPTGWHWSGFVLSTAGELAEGLTAESDEVVQPLKSALLAAALVDLASLDEDFSAGRQFAISIAERLAANQREDGALPFRVNGRTGEWLSGESSAVGFAMILWRRLRDQFGDRRFDVAEKKALGWLVKGPLATNRWIANFEDVPTEVTDSDSSNLNNWDAVFTARYLIARSKEEPDLLDLARKVEEWVENEFMFAAPEGVIEPLHFLGPVVMEQSVHFLPIDGHAANVARLEWALYEATGDGSYREKAEALLNALTHYFDAQGRPLTYAPDPEVGYGFNDLIWFASAALSWMALTEGALRTGRAGGSDPSAILIP